MGKTKASRHKGDSDLDKNNISKPSIQADHFTKRSLEAKNTVFLLNFKQGQMLPVHTHSGSNVQILMLQGERMFTVDGKEVAAVKEVPSSLTER